MTRVTQTRQLNGVVIVRFLGTFPSLQFASEWALDLGADPCDLDDDADVLVMHTQEAGPDGVIDVRTELRAV